MHAPTAEALTETLTHAIEAANQLIGDFAIVLYDSTYPAGRNPDRPTRVQPPPPEGDPDFVPGERLESGLGVERGKEACARALELAADARRLADAALGREVPPQRRLRPPGFRPHVLTTAARLRRLRDHGLAGAPDEARALAHAAAVALLEAHVAVRGVMRDYEQVGEVPADSRCWNCQRPVVYVRSRECEACSKYRRRAEAAIRTGRVVKHRFRPVPRFQAEHEARRRRAERLLPGQLDIEGPPPAGTYRDGEWTPATPHPEPRREAS